MGDRECALEEAGARSGAGSATVPGRTRECRDGRQRCRAELARQERVAPADQAVTMMSTAAWSWPGTKEDTRSMLAMMRRPTERTPGSTENFESTRRPCAKPLGLRTVAHRDTQQGSALSARASLTPSPSAARNAPVPTIARFCSGPMIEHVVVLDRVDEILRGQVFGRSRASMRRVSVPSGAGQASQPPSARLLVASD